MNHRTVFRSALCVCALVGSSSALSAAIIEQGLYRLHNHPDGSATPPPYGMRLDELFNVTSDHDIFTFDFDDARSDMKLTYDGSTIRIFGSVWGGRDIGSAFANEATTGLYIVDFTYDLGIRLAGGDDDLVVDTDNRANDGYIIAPTSPDKIALVDQRLDGFSFRFGDEDNDQGHRGFAGISGWGWLTHNPATLDHIAASDWLFTAELIPSPATLMLAAPMMLGLRRRGR